MEEAIDTSQVELPFVESGTSWFGISSGFLPKWLFIVGVISIINFLRAVWQPAKTGRRIYTRSPLQVTELAGRIFSSWTLSNAAIRLYGAFNIHNKQVYELVMLTYFLVFSHLILELFIYRGVNKDVAGISPIIVAVGTLTVMWRQYNYYVYDYAAILDDPNYESVQEDAESVPLEASNSTDSHEEL